MSNVNADKTVQHDWWGRPIPPNIAWGEGFYCESAQIFRHFKSTREDAVVLGKHVSCYAGCSFSLGTAGTCSVGDFTLLNGVLIMAEERIEIGSRALAGDDIFPPPGRTGAKPPARRRGLWAFVLGILFALAGLLVAAWIAASVGPAP